MDRRQTWIVSVVSIIALLTLFCLGWAVLTVQDRLIQSAGHSLVQAATDAASKLDMMILERYHDIQLLSTAPITQGQNPETLTQYLRELVQAHPAYRWIGITDLEKVEGDLNIAVGHIQRLEELGEARIIYLHEFHACGGTE